MWIVARSRRLRVLLAIAIAHVPRFFFPARSNLALYLRETSRSLPTVVSGRFANTRSQKRREICRPLPGIWRIAGSSIAGRVCACYSNDRQLLPLPVNRGFFRSYSGNNGSRQRLFDPAIMAAGNMQLQGPAIWAAGNIN